MNPLPNFDPDKLPLRRFIRWLMDNDLKKRYLVIIEAVLLALLAVCIFLYVR